MLKLISPFITLKTLYKKFSFIVNSSSKVISKIEAVWLAVTLFIKWHNERNK